MTAALMSAPVTSESLVASVLFPLSELEQPVKLKTGEETVLGLSDDGIGYTLEGSNIKVSDETVELLEEIKEKIISGEIEVPSEL